MLDSTSSGSQYSLMPLGAGDLIDRAIRFYRKNFWTFVLIASPPIVAATFISVGWTILGRAMFSVGSARNPADLVGFYLFTSLGMILIWTTETVATLTVMGGASRNFVRHLLFGEPITFRETYQNVRKRFFGLIAASAVITILLAFIGGMVASFGMFAGLFLIGIAAALLSFFPTLAVIVGIILALGVIFFTGWLFFLVASRFAYVPQVMLVEGLGVFSALGRSASLASGNVKRLAALFVFTTVATYSALAILYLPLTWYAWINGVEILPWMDTEFIPVWYEVANQVIWQVSLILLIPVWMVGLCLLYVDERVRHEGYDIELMAARRLGEIPAVPAAFVNPLQPALANQPLPPRPAQNRVTNEKSPFTTLGLK